MKTTFILALVLLSVPACGGPYLFAEVEESRVCVTAPGQIVRGEAAGDVSMTALEGEIDMGVGIPGLDNTSAITGTVELTSFTLDSTTDLSGVTTATLEIFDTTDTASTEALLDGEYSQPAALSDPNQMAFAIDQPPVNLLEPLSRNEGVVQFRVTFEGDLPQEDWTTDVTACAMVRITFDLTKL